MITLGNVYVNSQMLEPGYRVILKHAFVLQSGTKLLQNYILEPYGKMVPHAIVSMLKHGIVLLFT